MAENKNINDYKINNFFDVNNVDINKLNDYPLIKVDHDNSIVLVDGIPLPPRVKVRGRLITRLKSTAMGNAASWLAGDEARALAFNKAPYNPIVRALVNFEYYEPNYFYNAIDHGNKYVYGRNNLHPNIILQAGKAVINFSAYVLEPLSDHLYSHFLLLHDRLLAHKDVKLQGSLKCYVIDSYLRRDLPDIDHSLNVIGNNLRYCPTKSLMFYNHYISNVSYYNYRVIDNNAVLFIQPSRYKECYIISRDHIDEYIHLSKYLLNTTDYIVLIHPIPRGVID